MLDVVELVLPLFGLIFLGYIAGRLARIPFEGLAWMNFFHRLYRASRIILSIAIKYPGRAVLTGWFYRSIDPRHIFNFLHRVSTGKVSQQGQHSRGYNTGTRRSLRQYRIFRSASGDSGIRTCGRSPHCAHILFRKRDAFHPGATAHGGGQ